MTWVHAHDLSAIYERAERATGSIGSVTQIPILTCLMVTSHIQFKTRQTALSVNAHVRLGSGWTYIFVCSVLASQPWRSLQSLVLRLSHSWRRSFAVLLSSQTRSCYGLLAVKTYLLCCCVWPVYYVWSQTSLLLCRQAVCYLFKISIFKDILLYRASVLNCIYNTRYSFARARILRTSICNQTQTRCCRKLKMLLNTSFQNIVYRQLLISSKIDVKLSCGSWQCYHTKYIRRGSSSKSTESL